MSLMVFMCTFELRWGHSTSYDLIWTCPTQGTGTVYPLSSNPKSKTGIHNYLTGDR